MILISARYYHIMRAQELECMILRQLADDILDIVIIGVDTSEKVIYTNDTIKLTFGYSLAEILLSDVVAIFTEESDKTRMLDQARKSGHAQQELYMLRADKTRFFALVMCRAIRDAEGVDLGFSMIVRDLSNKLRIDKELSFLKDVLAQSPHGLVELSINEQGKCKIFRVNNHIQEMTGLSEQELLNSSFSSLFTESDKFDTFQTDLLTSALGDTTRVHQQFTLRNTGGNLMPVLVNGFTFVKGRVVYIIVNLIQYYNIYQAERINENIYLRSLIEASIDAWMVLSVDGTIIDVNHAMEQLTGIGRKILIKSDFANIFTEPVLAQDLLQKVITDKRIVSFPLVIKHVERKFVYVACNASIIQDDHNKMQKVIVTIHDMTEQKKAQFEQKKNNVYVRSLIETNLDGLMVISPSEKITDVNQAFISMTGVDKDHLIHSDFYVYFTEPLKVKEGQSMVLKDSTIRDYPLTLRNTNGPEIDVLFNASIYEDEYGNVQGIVASVRDITERKKNDELVRKTSLYVRTIIEAIVDPLMVISPQGKITDVNKAMESMTGYGKRRLVDTDFAVYFMDESKAKDALDQVLTHGTLVDYPLEIRNVNEQITDVLYNMSLYKNESGLMEGVIAVARDITILKSAEKKQEDTIAYARKIIESSLDPLVTEDTSYLISDLNSATMSMTGLSKEQILGTSFSDYFENPKEIHNTFVKAYDEPVIDLPTAIKHSTGTLTPVLLTISVWEDNFGNVKGVFATARNVSKQVEAEKERQIMLDTLETIVETRTKELQVALKSAEDANQMMSNFLTQISHEIRTPLHGIASLSQINIDKVPVEIKEYIEMGKLSGDILLHILEEIMDFDKPLQLYEIDFSLEALLNMIKRYFAMDIKIKDIDIQLQFDKTTPKVLRGDAHKLGQIIIEITDNLTKYPTTTADTIMISIVCHVVDNKHITLEFEIGNKSILSSKGRQALTELFSKPIIYSQVHRGLWMGLHLVQKMIAMMDGTIEFKSDDKMGTLFTFTLPFEVPPAKPIKELILGKHVLVVEDNLINQKIAKKMIESLGCTAVVADNGKKGMDEYVRNRLHDKKRYDIILMDIQMPVMDGVTATIHIRQIERQNGWDPVLIFAVSAYVTEHDKKKSYEAGMNDFIGKPVSVTTMTEILSNV